MNYFDIDKPTYEMGTGPNQFRFFDQLSWRAELDKPDTVTVNVSGFDFDEEGRLKHVRVTKGEIVTKLLGAGAVKNEFLQLLELDPKHQLPLTPLQAHSDQQPEFASSPLPERSEEARRYDRTDWPGSSSFQPPHLRDIDSILENGK